MLTVCVESFTDGIEELKVLLPMHWEELALNRDKVPLSPNWEEYKERDANGSIIYVTLRNKGYLVGYFVGFIAPGMHYTTCLTCIMDIFYIHPDVRGQFGGVKLFRFVEKELKRRGVQRMVVGSKNHKDASCLFDFLGYTMIETFYSVWLGE